MSREDVGKVDHAGAVHILYGAPDGLSPVENQFWHQDSPGILDDADVGDFFGLQLACMPSRTHHVFLPIFVR